MNPAVNNKVKEEDHQEDFRQVVPLVLPADPPPPPAISPFNFSISLSV